MRPLLLSLFAALPLACASAQRPAPAARPAHRFVRVHEGTTLRTRPDDQAPGVTVAVGATLRRVRARGEWVELETMPTSARQCAPSLAPPGGMRLRFFARSSSIAPVLAAPISLSGPQGSLSVQPGVALRGASGLDHAGLRLTLSAAPTTALEHPAPQPDRPVARAERLAPGTRVTLPEGATAEVTRDPPVYVLSRRATGEGARVVVATPCVRFEAVVADGAVLPALELDVDDRGDDPPGARWAVRRGARLRWADGSPAGRTGAGRGSPTRAGWSTARGASGFRCGCWEGRAEQSPWRPRCARTRGTSRRFAEGSQPVRGAPRSLSTRCGRLCPSSTNSSEAELRQYRCLVGGGPSGNTCPRCPPQRWHRISVRTIP
jgi:hypothetical protein